AVRSDSCDARTRAAIRQTHPYVKPNTVWANLHVKDRAARREKAVLHLFGVTEPTLRSTFGLSEEILTQLLNDPLARHAYALQLKEGLDAIARRHDPLSYGADHPRPD